MRYLILVLLCSISAASSAQEVVVSINPLRLLVKELVEEPTIVTTVIKKGTDPHLYELTPKTAKRIEGSAAFIINGRSFEHWVPGDLPESKLFPIIPPDEKVRNVHAWLDPKLIERRIRPLAQFLCVTLKQDCTKTVERASILEAKLSKTISELASRSARLTQKSFVATHGAWSSFAESVGLNLAGVVKDSESRFIGTRDFARVADLVKKYRIVTLAVDPTTPPELIATLSRDLSLKSVVLDEMAGDANSLEEWYRELYVTLEHSLLTGVPS